MATGDIQVVPVTRLPQNAWFEGFAIRPNGYILATRLDKPELYTFDPDDEKSKPEVVCTFPEATGLINLCPLEDCDDEYAVIAADVDMAATSFENACIWRVALSDSDKPVLTKVTPTTECGFPIGVMPASARTLLLADSSKSCIWRLDLPTATISLLIADGTMNAATKEDFFGINRLRISNGYLYYTNTSAGLLCRVPIRDDDEKGIETAGDVEIIAADLLHCDGLAITDDGKTLFTTSYMGGLVWRVDTDSAGKGATTVLAKNLGSPTCVALAKAGDQQKLYVICCGSDANVGWIQEDDKMSEKIRLNLAEISVTVEVVQETVEEAA